MCLTEEGEFGEWYVRVATVVYEAEADAVGLHLPTQRTASAHNQHTTSTSSDNTPNTIRTVHLKCK